MQSLDSSRESGPDRLSACYDAQTLFYVIESVTEPQSMRLGEILIARGKLDAAGVERALRMQRRAAKNSARCSCRGLGAQRDVSEALAAQLGLPLVDIAGDPEFPVLEERISPRFLREARALPLREDESELALAMADPTDSYTVGAFRMVTGREVKPQVAIPSELDAALERLYGAGRTAVGQIVGDVEQRDELAFDADIQQLKDLASEAPVIRLVSLLITNALEARLRHPHRAVGIVLRCATGSTACCTRSTRRPGASRPR